MSYTVGVKRNFWFGHRKVTVNGHDWQNGRFILNLTDGSQEHIPGFSTPGVKVYADFWTHLAQIERSRPAPPPMPVRQPVNVAPQPVAQIQPMFETEPDPEPEQEIPESAITQEAKRRATEHIQRILGAN